MNFFVTSSYFAFLYMCFGLWFWFWLLSDFFDFDYILSFHWIFMSFVYVLHPNFDCVEGLRLSLRDWKQRVHLTYFWFWFWLVRVFVVALLINLFLDGFGEIRWRSQTLIYFLESLKKCALFILYFYFIFWPRIRRLYYWTTYRK